MPGNNNIELVKVADISKKIVDSIEVSKDQIHDIIENTRNEVEHLRRTLEETKTLIGQIISEVDNLEMQDKMVRQKLADVSKNFKVYTERDIKHVYDQALEIKSQLSIKRHQEKDLRAKRDQLEISLMKAIKNIENGERVMTQISVAVSYLKGEIISVIEGMDKNAEFVIGIKILEAQEDERKRISREIHDGPAQSIANIVMQADICEQMMKKDINAGLKELQVLKTNVKSALFDIRGIIFDLRPMILDDLGLTKTIETICNKFTEATGVHVETRLKRETGHVDAIIQVAVMRVIQEALNNIKKHAKAKRVMVSLEYGAKYLFIQIADDGVGFDVDAVMERIRTRSESFGLVGLMDRVKQLQGVITLKSTVGVGTTYSIKLPVDKEVMKDDSF